MYGGAKKILSVRGGLEPVGEAGEHRATACPGLSGADVYLNRTYLESFSAAPIVPETRALMDTTKLRLLEITKIVYDQKEKFTDKLKSVYSALHSLNSAVALLIQSDGDAVRFFIGTRSVLNAAIAGDVLESTLKGNFPGISYCTLSVSETEKMIDEIKKVWN